MMIDATKLEFKELNEEIRNAGVSPNSASSLSVCATARRTERVRRPGGF